MEKISAGRQPPVAENAIWVKSKRAITYDMISSQLKASATSGNLGNTRDLPAGWGKMTVGSGRAYEYIAHEHLIDTNRVKDAIAEIKKNRNVTSRLQVAGLLGLNWRSLYRLQQHKVLPHNLGHSELKRWSDLTKWPIGYLTGELK